MDPTTVPPTDPVPDTRTEYAAGGNAPEPVPREDAGARGATARGRLIAAVLGYAVLLIAAWAGLELWGLGSTPFHTKGEPREGLVVWEMTHGGGWILPRRNGVELPSKPPLFHWLGALTSVVRGVTDEGSIRFPSAAASLLSVLCAFGAGAAWWTPRAGFMSAVVLMTTFEWARAATNARVDMTLTFGLQLAFLSWLFFVRQRRVLWLVPLYVGITWAVLGKGPVGAALPGLLALTMMALARDFSPVRQMRFGVGAFVVAVGAGTWYVLALLLGGWAFFRKQVLAENLFTFLDDPTFGGGHRHTVVYLFGALLLGILPWTPFLGAAAVRLWRERRRLTMNDPRVHLLIWIGVVFTFYGFAASKRSVYLLALYPAVALLLGWWWDQQSRESADRMRWLALVLTWLGWPVAAALTAGVLLSGLECSGLPVIATLARWLPPPARTAIPLVGSVLHASPWLLLPALVAITAGIVAMIFLARSQRWLDLFATCAVTTAIALTGAQRIVLPVVARQESLRAFMTDVRRIVGPDGIFYFYNMFDYEAVFYSQGHITAYTGTWPDDAPRYLLMRRVQWDELQASARNLYEVAVGSQTGTLDPADPVVLVRRVGGA